MKKQGHPRTIPTVWALLLLSSLLAIPQCQSTTFNEPENQLRDQTFSVLEFQAGTVNQRYEGTLQYYCTFRGKWTEKRHPNDFPRSASWSAPIIISHSNSYRMWTGTEAATLGVESIAEEGFATIITNEFNNAGFETLHMVIGERMFNTSESQHLPPINVTFEHPYLSAMVKMTPSPDWFVGFSDFRTISYDTETYYNRIVIKSFVWDCGTDGGQTYTALDRDLDPQVPVERFYATNVPPKGQFLSPDGTFIPTPAEFECILRVGEGEVVPGVPFNESQIRPELYVPRDDDWIGDPAYDQNRCAHGNFKGCEGYMGGADDDSGSANIHQMGKGMTLMMVIMLGSMVLGMATVDLDWRL